MPNLSRIFPRQQCRRKSSSSPGEEDPAVPLSPLRGNQHLHRYQLSPGVGTSVFIIIKGNITIIISFDIVVIEPCACLCLGFEIILR
jgi:hypothetical protein